MRRRHRASSLISNSEFHPIYSDYREVVHSWMLQLLISLGAHKGIIKADHCTEDDVLSELGLSCLIEAEKFNGVEVRQTLQKMHAELSPCSIADMPGHTQLARNIKWLGNLIGLSQTEQAILHFRVIASRHLPLRDCLDNLGQAIDLLYAAHILGQLLGVDASEIEQALKPGACLIRTGLISVSPKLENLMGKIELLEGLADNLFVGHESPYSLFKDNFTSSGAARLTAQDYPHLSADIALLKIYLAVALEEKRIGVNVLIYGTPGSGKTEFVKMLAHEINHPLFEIATESATGEPIRSAYRFRSFRLSQYILVSNESSPLILFDEVEDVFDAGSDKDEPEGSNAGGMKGWINKLLEGNQIPSFWLSNNLGCLDKAFVRRFDYVIELNAPPRSVRSKILDQYLEGIEVSASWKNSMVEHEYLNPAVVERAAKVIEAVKHRQPELHTEKALDRILGNTLEALGLSRSPKNATQNITGYRLDILNTDCNLAEVSEGLREHGEGRMCLYGAPGTGKSAFGRYLAETLDRPLMVRRASDILSPYVGVAEQNMARMFREAAEENAVLLLDEADTFLRDRNGATRSWEVSQVNEMLTQMERFEGIFIASTNLMESLDGAAMRRFDLKIKFDYLKPAQAWQLFLDMAEKFNMVASETCRPMLAKLHLLTPGDFANVVRQSRLRNIRSSQDLLDRLDAECQVKPEGGKRAIGFCTS